MNEIKLYVTAYIKPEFIKLQYDTFKKYCKDNYEIIIINNAIDSDMFVQIKDMCTSLGLNNITIPKPVKGPEYCSQSHKVAIEYVLQEIVKKNIPSDVIFLDSDIFAFKPFSFLEMMNGKQLAGMYQQRTKYEYPAGIIMMFDKSVDISNFSFHLGMGDTGGAINTLMQKHSIQWIKHTAAIDIETDYIFKCNTNLFPYKPNYRCQFLGDSLLHYYRGSNWEQHDPIYDKNKFAFVNNFINNLSEYCLNLDDNVCYEHAQSNKGYDGADHHYNNYRFIDNVKK